MPLENLTFSNVTISAATGMKIYHAREVRFINSNITVQSGRALTTYNADVTGLEK